MAYDLEDKLVVAISSRALLALDAENQIFETQGVDAYCEYQRAHENDTFQAGTAMPLVKGLLRINEVAGKPLVEVIVVSQNDADTGLRIMNSAHDLGLDISRAGFTAGADAWPYLKPFKASLFLSADPQGVQKAINNGFAAARVLQPPDEALEDIDGPVPLAFDGDAVLFDAESELIYQEQGIEAFLAREADLADTPMTPGPFANFLTALGRVQTEVGPENPVIRTAW